MSKKEYKTFINKSIKRFAKENVKSGFWKQKEALEESKSQYKRNMGKGYKESKYDFYNILNNNHEKVGYLHLSKEYKLLFISEIYIRKKYRNLGYGKATLNQVEIVAQNVGIKKVGLYIFSHNEIAKSLYTQSGFNTISEFRIKRI